MKNKSNKGIFAIMMLLPFAGYTQVSVDKTVLNTNLYDVFINGTVRMKNGHIEEALLNYDTEHQSILFKKNDQVLTLTDLSSVDTVYIADRKFVPVEDNFYEIIPEAGSIGLYV